MTAAEMLYRCSRRRNCYLGVCLGFILLLVQRGHSSFRLKALRPCQQVTRCWRSARRQPNDVSIIDLEY